MYCFTISVIKCLQVHGHASTRTASDTHVCVGVCSRSASLTQLAAAECEAAPLMKDKERGLSLPYGYYTHNSLHNKGELRLAFVRGIRGLI